MPDFPYISGTDLHFDTAVVGATSYQIQRSGEAFGLKDWENIGSPVGVSPFDFSSYILTKAMYLRVRPMAGATLIGDPSDAVFYDRNFGSADPASSDLLNLELSFRDLIHERIGLAEPEIVFAGHPQGPKSYVIDSEHIDYGDREFSSDSLGAWIALNDLPHQGTQELFSEWQIDCLTREPHDRYNFIVKKLADLVFSSLNVEQAVLYDYSTGQPQAVTCGLSGTPLQYAPRCRLRGPIAFNQDDGVAAIPLTYTLALYREAAVP